MTGTSVSVQMTSELFPIPGEWHMF